MSFHVPEQYRIVRGEMGSDALHGNNGAFLIPNKFSAQKTLRVIASDGMGWEHVSVSLQTRTPTWEEMCSIKDLFWDEEDCVVQYHPPKSEYVNCHPHCLHLWKSCGENFIRPPSLMVGPI